MTIQLFQKLGEKEIKLIETNIGLIDALINPMQQNDWVEFLIDPLTIPWMIES